MPHLISCGKEQRVMQLANFSQHWQFVSQREVGHFSLVETGSIKNHLGIQTYAHTEISIKSCPLEIVIIKECCDYISKFIYGLCSEAWETENIVLPITTNLISNNSNLIASNHFPCF